MRRSVRHFARVGPTRRRALSRCLWPWGGTIHSLRTRVAGAVLVGLVEQPREGVGDAGAGLVQEGGEFGVHAAAMIPPPDRGRKAPGSPGGAAGGSLGRQPQERSGEKEV